MSSEPTFLNFPIIFLQDAFENIEKTMQNVMHYAGYVHTLKLEYGSSSEMMESAGSYFGITYGNVHSGYENGETLFESVPLKTPMVGINKDVLFDFYKNRKTNDEIAVLLAFLGLKSIIGTKPYVSTNNDFMIARMGGYASKGDVSGYLEALKKDEDVKLSDFLPEPLAGYTTRRKLDNIKFKLQTEWNINYYSERMRGFLVSIDNVFPLDRLVLETEKRKKKTKQAQLKAKKAEARNEALRKLRDNDEMEF